MERADSFPVKHVKTFLTGPLLRRCLRGPGSGSAPCGERGQASLHFNFVLVLSPQQNLFSLLGFRIRCLCSDQQGPCGGWSHSLPHGGASWRCCWLPGLGWSPCCTPTPLSSPSPPPPRFFPTDVLSGLRTFQGPLCCPVPPPLCLHVHPPPRRSSVGAAQSQERPGLCCRSTAHAQRCRNTPRGEIKAPVSRQMPSLCCLIKARPARRLFWGGGVRPLLTDRGS